MAGKTPIQNFGYIYRPADADDFAATLPHHTFAEAAPHLEGIGRGRTALGHKWVEKVFGRPIDSGPQETGDCAGWAGAGAIDVRACADVLMHAQQKERYSWDLRASVEWIYSMAREIGKFQGKDQGANVSWVANAIWRKGTISRALVGSDYSGTRSDVWGRTGPPAKWYKAAEQHKVASLVRIRTSDQCRDAICSGNPTMLGFNNVGFNSKRDRHGFCGVKGLWNHAMLCLGYRSDIEGFLLKNHSGLNEHSGEPMGEYAIPGSCFWVRPNIMQRILNCGDSWSVIGFDGYNISQNMVASLEHASTDSV